MRWTNVLIGLLLAQGLAPPAFAAPGKIFKVLPQLLDEKGQHTVAPSLYARDAYQAFLRAHPDKCSGIRFAIQWKAHVKDSGRIKLRVEVRGSKEAVPLRLEQPVKRTGLFNRWTSIPLTGESFRQTGEVNAWRATLWDGDVLLAEQKSFLW
jgi:hypothetical protein